MYWNKKETYFYQPALSPLSHQSCWNCGRKASETCSGCNTARYCGSFCQHKDWEKHHHVCGQGLQGLPGGSSVPLGTPSSNSAASSAPPTHPESTPPGPLSLVGQSSITGGAGSGSGSVSASPKESSSSSASRSTTPATPALLDATSRWRPTLFISLHTDAIVPTRHTKPNWGISIAYCFLSSYPPSILISLLSWALLKIFSLPDDLFYLVTIHAPTKKYLFLSLSLYQPRKNKDSSSGFSVVESMKSVSFPCVQSQKHIRCVLLKKHELWLEGVIKMRPQ